MTGMYHHTQLIVSDGRSLTFWLQTTILLIFTSQVAGTISVNYHSWPIISSLEGSLYVVDKGLYHLCDMQTLHKISLPILLAASSKEQMVLILMRANLLSFCFMDCSFVMPKKSLPNQGQKILFLQKF
jgi:hypothetical protein